MFLTAVPDLRVQVVDSVAEGDKVVSRWSSRGTNTGPMVGPMGTMPPTGREATVDGVTICRLINGKIVEEWAIFDMLGLLQRLGAIRAPA